MNLRRTILAALAAWAVAGPPAARAYVLEGWHWPDDTPIVMDLRLGNPDHILIDGSASWDDVAEAAIAVWNPYLSSGVQLQAVEDTSVPMQGDGKNEVFFSANAYGESFGEDTLAVTLTHYDTSTGLAIESDVVVSSTVSYDSYRGDQRLNSAGEPAYDLRRVLIHEFGHVLGLGHPPSGTVAIMDPVISDLDTVQGDDIDGVEAIYGALTPVITSKLNAAGNTVQAFTYQIASVGLQPVFGASGLPGGLSIDPATGVISGTPTAPGVYHVVISATNTAGMDSAVLTLTISAPPVITSSLTVNAPLNQPFSYQVAAANGPTSFSATGLPGGLSIDPATGAISGVAIAPGTFFIVLTASNALGQDTQTLTLKVALTDGSLVFLHGFSPADGAYPSTPPIQAADGNFYGTTSSGTVYRMTPDGTVTVVHVFSSTEGEQPDGGVIQGADGNFYGACKFGAANGVGMVYRLTLDGTLTTLHVFTPQEGFSPAPLIQAADGNLYGVTTLSAAPNYYTTSLFKLTPDGTYSVLYSYTDAATETVLQSLLQAADGSFYGVVSGSFEVTPALFHFTSDGTFSIVRRFDELGNGASVSLTVAPDGGFYGTTDGVGIIFKLAPDGTLTTLHSFTAVEGISPSALIQAGDGNLYGTAYGGGDVTTTGSTISTLNGKGTLFALKPDGTFATLYIFDGTRGVSPSGGLVRGNDGYLYGVTVSGGVGDGLSDGTIFRKGLVDIPSNLTLTASVTAAPQFLLNSPEPPSFTVALAHPAAKKVTVHYTLKGNAVNGVDYTRLSGSVKFRPGVIIQKVKIVPIGLPGGLPKTVRVSLVAGKGYVVGTAKRATVQFTVY